MLMPGGPGSKDVMSLQSSNPKIKQNTLMFSPDRGSGMQGQAQEADYSANMSNVNINTKAIGGANKVLQNSMNGVLNSSNSTKNQN